MIVPGKVTCHVYCLKTRREISISSNVIYQARVEVFR